jgi:hypothetical protein
VPRNSNDTPPLASVPRNSDGTLVSWPLRCLWSILMQLIFSHGVLARAHVLQLPHDTNAAGGNSSLARPGDVACFGAPVRRQ